MRTRRLLAVAVLVASILAAVQAWRLEVDNRLERWTSDHQDQDYRRLRETFGSDEIIVVAISGPDILSSSTMQRLLPIIDELEKVEGVDGVEGLPVIFRDVYGARAEALGPLLAGATRSPFYQNLFLSPDARVLGLILQTTPPNRSDGRRRLTEDLENVLGVLSEQGYQVDLVGSPILAAALDRVSLEEGGRYFLWSGALALVLLAALLRSPRAMLVPALCALASVTITLGLMSASGIALNMITSALPALLGVLSLAGSIHLITRYQALALCASPKQALESALKELTRPMAVAALTTALGFASLLAANMTPIRELGALAAAGMVVSLLVNLTLGPALIIWLRSPGRPESFGSALGHLASWSTKHPATIVVFFLFLLVILLAALPALTLSSSPLSFLPREDATVQAYQRVGETLTGYYTLEVMVDLPGPWWQRDTAGHLHDLSRSLSQSPIVARVLSPLDLICQASFQQTGSYELPEVDSQTQVFLAHLEANAEDSLRALATADGETIRLSVIVKTMDENSLLALVDQTRRSLDLLPQGFSGQVTGLVPRLVQAQRLLLETQLRSLGLAIILVLLAIGVGLASWRLALLALAPNLLPILGIFGIMGLAGIPLDAATATVASIALGIGVDDAVHMVQGYARRRKTSPTATALRWTLVEVGPALVVTTATACLGFGLLLGSSFVPIRHFALLATAALVLALLAAILWVPAVLQLVSRGTGEDSGSNE